MMTVTAGQIWNTCNYAENGRFVARLASSTLELLATQPGERILDLGCGDGALTEQIATLGAQVQGVDASAAMTAAARARGLEVLHCTAQAMPFEGEFDAVFSNAALHWIAFEQQPAALAAVHRALKPDGRFVGEMGSQGNIAAIRTALAAFFAQLGLDAEAIAASFFPSTERYRAMLEQAGFQVERIDMHPRPTPLPGGSDGMRIWLETFRNGVLNRLPADLRPKALAETVELLRPILYDPAMDSWTADYIRLRFRATRSA